MEKEILELREKGYTYNQIKEKLGCSKSTISYYCRQNGVSRYDNTTKLTQEQISIMQSYYDEVKSSLKVSKKFNISKHIVYKYLKINKRIKKTEEEIKEKRKKDVVKNVIYWRKKIKKDLVEYKGGVCEVIGCGYNKCLRSLQFHHINPKEKDFSISGKTMAFNKMKNEVDKCVLVCNNCHGEIHDEIDNIGYSKIVNKIISNKNLADLN